MSKSHLLKYLLISPNLPVGGFCYSEGMESYLHNKNLKDSNAIKDLIKSELTFGQIRLDAKLLLDFFVWRKYFLFSSNKNFTVILGVLYCSILHVHSEILDDFYAWKIYFLYLPI